MLMIQQLSSASCNILKYYNLKLDFFVHFQYAGKFNFNTISPVPRFIYSGATMHMRVGTSVSIFLRMSSVYFGAFMGVRMHVYELMYKIR